MEDSFNRRPGLRLIKAALLLQGLLCLGLAANSQEFPTKAKIPAAAEPAKAQPTPARLPPLDPTRPEIFAGASPGLPPSAVTSATNTPDEMVVPNAVVVPNLLGHTVDQARKMLPKGLTLQTRYAEPDQPAGMIFIEAVYQGEFRHGLIGTPVAPGTEISVVISMGAVSSTVQPREARLPPTGLSGYVPPSSQPVPVPYLIGHTLDEARQLVPESSGLILEQPRYIPSNAPAGTVVRQYPEAKSLVKRGTEVSIYVSQGQPATPQARPTPVAVPNVVGLKQDVAEEKIRFAGLAVGTVNQQEWNGAPLTVLSQDPSADVRVAANTPVSLVISREVPRTVTLTSLETSATPGEPVHFQVRLSPPADGAQFQFDFGDGQRSDWSSDAYISHAYANDGNWPVRATVEVSDLSLPSNELTIPVHAVKFAVSFTPSTLHARVGDPINFHASIAPSSDGVIYIFDFNDGTTQPASPNPDASHTYTKPGTYLTSVKAIVSVPGALAADSHKFSSPRVRIVIDPAPPGPPPPPNYWLWGAIAVALGGLGALGLRSAVRRNQRAPRGRAPAITVVVPSGTFTVKSNGRLWSRIERNNGE